jgi:hypothetical protein
MAVVVTFDPFLLARLSLSTKGYWSHSHVADRLHLEPWKQLKHHQLAVDKVDEVDVSSASTSSSDRLSRCADFEILKEHLHEA